MKTVISSKFAPYYKAAGEKKFGKDLQENFAYFEALYIDRLHIAGVSTTPLEFPVKSETVVYVEEDKFGFYTQSMIVRRIGSKFFFKSNLTKRFTFKGGKMYGEVLSNMKAFRTLLSSVPHLEWFKAILDDREINIDFLPTVPNRLWLKVFSGKITNPKMFWNEWSKTSYHNMVPGWALKVFKLNRINIYDAEMACTNLCSLAQKLKNLNCEEISLIRDLIKDSVSLRGLYRINPSKGIDQLCNEHVENSMKIESGKLDHRVIYSEDTIKSFKDSSYAKDNQLKLISSAVESYKEAKRFSNCSYNHYWESAAIGSYILMVSELYDAMIGMRKFHDGWSVDQIYGHCNRRVSEDVFDILSVASTALINSINPKVVKNSDNHDHCTDFDGLTIELVDDEPELPW